jgi:hypothetical protein
MKKNEDIKPLSKNEKIGIFLIIVGFLIGSFFDSQILEKIK